MSSFADRTRDLGRLLWRKAKQGGETAADMLEQQAHIQRLAGQVRKAERDRKALFAQIGMKVYALHSQGKVRNHDVLSLCHELDTLAAEVARLKQQIEDLRTASLAQGQKIPELEDLSALTAEGEDETVAVAEADTSAEAEMPAASEAAALEDDKPAEAVTEEPSPAAEADAGPASAKADE